MSSLAAAAITSGTQALSGLATANVSYKNNKKLLEQQQQYNRENFELANARQDYLLANQAAIYKRSLQNAGYSTADPSGIGSQVAGVNQISPASTPGVGMANFGKLDLLSAQLLDAQKENIQADTAKKIKETEGQEIQNYLNQTYGADQIEAALANMDASTRERVSQSLYLDSKKLNEIKLTDAEIDNIEMRLDMDYARLTPQIRLMAAQAYQASQSGALSKSQIDQVYQAIKESEEKIKVLKSEYGLNDAQIAVATNLAEKYAQETRLTGYETVSAAARADLNQLERDVQKSMGFRYYQARRVVDAIIPIGAAAAIVGKAVGK